MALAATLLATITSLVVWLIANYVVGMTAFPAIGLAIFVGQMSFFLFIAKALTCRALRMRHQERVSG